MWFMTKCRLLNLWLCVSEYVEKIYAFPLCCLGVQKHTCINIRWWCLLPITLQYIIPETGYKMLELIRTIEQGIISSLKRSEIWWFKLFRVINNYHEFPFYFFFLTALAVYSALFLQQYLLTASVNDGLRAYWKQISCLTLSTQSWWQRTKAFSLNL